MIHRFRVLGSSGLIELRSSAVGAVGAMQSLVDASLKKRSLREREFRE